MTVLQVTSCGRQIDLAIAQDLSLTLNDEGMGDSISVPVCDGTMTVTSEDFSPLYLFQSGEKGVWFDPSDFSTMFQDSAGTTPVTAVGQAVGRILDKSGRGNHASQATPTARPILQQDATGRYYLDFDGTDDWLSTGTISPAVDKVQVFAGVRKLTDTSGKIIAEYSTALSNSGSFSLQASNGGGANYLFGSRGTAQAIPSVAATAPDTAVLYAIGNISGDVASVRRNGGTASTSVADQGTGNYGNYALYVGSRAGTSLRLAGRIYGLIVRFNATLLEATTISNTEAWMNLRTGAY